MHIPLTKPFIDEDDINNVILALKSGMVSSGRFDNLFEEEFSKLVEIAHCISMNSCTSALFVALKLLALKQGKVIVPSFTFPATINAVINAKLTPVIVDVDYASMNINSKIIENSLDNNTIGAVIVHFAGNPCDMDEISELINYKNIFLIEDCAHALGTYYNSKHAGSWGIGCFSFFATKNITTGEGGMLTCNDTYFAQKAKTFISHGINKKQNCLPERESLIPGQNFRLAGILGALGLSQLKKLKIINEKRKLLAIRYSTFLKNIEEIELPKRNKKGVHSWHMYIIKIQSYSLRNWLYRWLKDKNIEVSIHYRPSLHKHKIFNKYAKCRNGYPNTDKLENCVLTLPLYPGMSLEENDYVIEQIINGIKKCRKLNLR